MPPAPLASSASPTSAIGDLIAGGNPGAGADDTRARLTALVHQIGSIGQMVDAVAADFPNVAQEVGQIKTLLKQMAIKAAQQAPQATTSGSAVPTGASMGPNPM